MLLEALKKLGLGVLVIICVGLIMAAGVFLFVNVPVIGLLLFLGFSAYFIGDLILD